MSIIKCKMCGGDLELIPASAVCECEYCGSRQTVPTGDNEKKLMLFARANRLRVNCEFDKAAGIYESILAENPEEPEGYWGLVLCKYGIEYVTDPASGKKVPTCHRSSFDSVLKDSNFELAQEYADPVARKVCREEAKAIEELRKGILTVSASEKPYDIFICYKETDFEGKRTLDSVLAQDLYDALTAKGYRVFFSRISLEDKLGTAYEPYIFAALNSAKIMLVVGTEYEYFNAVWVKNEWSRFLKLMSKDSGRYLIPCYKGIDVYDMPEEFARLQAQDLSKMGATQDILRGVEKLLPKTASEPVIRERVILGTTAGNKIASLLDRGNMALEDGDWDKADSFFEDVLNNDSKNAEAYLGKTLAAEKCRTLDAFIRKRQELTKEADLEYGEVEFDHAYVQTQTAKYSISDYVDGQSIWELYDMDMRYPTQVDAREQQYAREETWWASHKTLSRAEKFASGELAEVLAAEKKRLFDVLAQRVKAAQTEETKAIEEVRRRWEEKKRQADARAAAMYEEGCRKREREYEKNLTVTKNSEDPAVLTRCAEAFTALGDFRDSKNLAAHCRKRAEEIREELRQKEIAEKARLAEEEERRIIAMRKAEREAEARKKKRMLLTVAAALVCFALFLLMVNVVIPTRKYKAAEKLEAEGKRFEAAAAFYELAGYDRCPDAMERSLEQWENIAIRTSFGTGYYHVAVLNRDGTVLAKGQNHGQLHVGNWTDIISVSTGTHHTVGLKSDGTVVSTKPEEKEDQAGQQYVTGWTGIVSISAAPYHTVGLKSNGTVVSTSVYSSHEYSKGQDKVGDWRNIVAVETGVAHTVGLKADGTVMATGWNADGQCDVGTWTDIVDLAAGVQHTVGLKADGTVVAVGANTFGQCDVENWTGIVAVAAGSHHTLGLRADGTVVATGYNNQGQCNVSRWHDIVALDAATDHTVGQMKDGTLVAVGKDHHGICELEEFTDVKILGSGQPNRQDAIEAMKAQSEIEKAAAYELAAALAAEGKTAEAAIAFGKLGQYRDALERSFALWNEVADRETLSGGGLHTIAVQTDGTVLAVGETTFDQCDVESWKNIIAVSGGYRHTLGLKADGTVVAAGYYGDGKCKVSSWTDMVAIAAGYDHSVGLRADGTVLAIGNNDYGQCNTSDWDDIVAIAAGECHTVGLKADGTVVAEGLNGDYQCQVSGWTDIVAIAAGQYHTVGLRSDGTVVATGNNNDNQCNVSGWTDIVAIAAGEDHTVGLKADGTVVAVGDNFSRQLDVQDWADVVAISAGCYHTLGLKPDGTAVAVGNKGYGRIDVTEWSQIPVPQR